MNRREVIEETVSYLRGLCGQMRGKEVMREDAEAQINGYGKILKGVQLHIQDEVVTRKLGGYYDELPAGREREVLPA